MVMSSPLLHWRVIASGDCWGLLPVATGAWSVRLSSETPFSTVKIARRMQRGIRIGFTAGKMGLSNKFRNRGVLTFYKKTGAPGKVIHRSAPCIDTQTVIQS